MIQILRRWAFTLGRRAQDADVAGVDRCSRPRFGHTSHAARRRCDVVPGNDLEHPIEQLSKFITSWATLGGIMAVDGMAPWTIGSVEWSLSIPYHALPYPTSRFSSGCTSVPLMVAAAGGPPRFPPSG